MSSAPAFEHSSAKVLIVEDEGLIAMDLRQRLNALGYTVADVVSTGLGAVESAAQHLPDIILMDIRLKGEMDGIEAARRIRAAADLPVVFVTSYADDATVKRALGSEPVAYLVKPFSDQELHTTIDVALYRHAMEGRMREQRVWLNSVLHSIGDAVIATDEHGSIRLMNREAERLTGWSEAEAAGRPFAEVVQQVSNPDSRWPAAHFGDTLSPGGLGDSGRFTILCRNGGETAIEYSRTSIAAGAATSGGTFVFRDITNRLRAEQELQHARRMEAVGRLAGGVAHDFNNLLTIILGVSSVAIGECGNHEMLRERFATIVSAAESAGTLTRKLLALGRKQVLDPKPLDINELVHDMRRMMRPVLSESAELEIQLLARQPKVLADRQQLEEAILNIFLNARDAVGDSGKVLVRTENTRMPEDSPETAGGDAVAIVISDTGIGIPPEVKSRIFEPFFTTKEGAHGTGLGLASAYGIVCQSGGRIDVESEVGKGSTFRIILPAYQKSEPAPPVLAGTPVASSRGGRVLLVEDNDLVRSLEQKVLTTAGMKVRHAPDGVEALNLLQAAPNDFDLIVTDVIMPNMNGVDFALRALEIRPDLRILFVSGYTEDIVQLDDFPEGTVAFLEKPFAPAALGKAVAELLGIVTRSVTTGN